MTMMPFIKLTPGAAARIYKGPRFTRRHGRLLDRHLSNLEVDKSLKRHIGSVAREIFQLQLAAK
jgi:hypothetical protein